MPLRPSLRTLSLALAVSLAAGAAAVWALGAQNVKRKTQNAAILVQRLRRFAPGIIWR